MVAIMPSHILVSFLFTDMSNLEQNAREMATNNDPLEENCDKTVLRILLSENGLPNIFLNLRHSSKESLRDRKGKRIPKAKGTIEGYYIIY